MKNEPKVNLLDVLKEVVEDKSVDDSVILDALKKALISAARKYLHIEKKINVDIDMETNEVHVFLNVEVVDDYPDYDPNMTADEVAEMDEGYMLVEEARDFNEDAQPLHGTPDVLLRSSGHPDCKAAFDAAHPQCRMPAHHGHLPQPHRYDYQRYSSSFGTT